MKQEWYQGPDISFHNGNVDIKRVRDAGYKRMGIRAGYGRDNVDQRYDKNALACYNLGMDVLLYWFSYAYTTAMAGAEADYAVRQAAKYWKKCPIAFDFEYDSVNYARKNGVAVGRNLATDMAAAFLKRVKEAGYIPVLYTNMDYLNRYFDLTELTAQLGEVYLWYARYAKTLSAAEADAADIWQFTSSGSVPGIRGRTDLNRFYTDFSGSVEKADRTEKRNLNIQDFQRAANLDGYRGGGGDALVEDGLDGPDTQFVRRQILLRARKTGEDYLVDSTGHVVKWWQGRCNEILGHRRAVDGKYGRITRADTLAMQRKCNLAVDGIAGYNSIQAAFYH